MSVLLSLGVVALLLLLGWLTREPLALVLRRAAPYVVDVTRMRDVAHDVRERMRGVAAYFQDCPEELALERWQEPLDLRGDPVRRVFAQEFVGELRRVGTASIAEMYDANVSLLSVPADEAELRQITEEARRMGWVEEEAVRGSSSGTEWAVTEAGLRVPRPDSLKLSQVVARVGGLADPVRKGATDWLPLLAVVVGALAGTEAAPGTDSNGTLTAVRILSLLVLSYALVRGGIGEWRLIQAAKAFDRLQKTPFYEKRRTYTSWPRLGVVAILDVAVVTAFGMGIFQAPCWIVPVVVAVFAAIVIERTWRRPARKDFRTRPPASP